MAQIHTDDATSMRLDKIRAQCVVERNGRKISWSEVINSVLDTIDENQGMAAVFNKVKL